MSLQKTRINLLKKKDLICELCRRNSMNMLLRLFSSGCQNWDMFCLSEIYFWECIMLSVLKTGIGSWDYFTFLPYQKIECVLCLIFQNIILGLNSATHWFYFDSGFCFFEKKCNKIQSLTNFTLLRSHGIMLIVWIKHHCRGEVQR